MKSYTGWLLEYAPEESEVIVLLLGEESLSIERFEVCAHFKVCESDFFRESIIVSVAGEVLDVLPYTQVAPMLKVFKNKKVLPWSAVAEATGVDPTPVFTKYGLAGFIEPEVSLSPLKTPYRLL